MYIENVFLTWRVDGIDRGDSHSGFDGTQRGHGKLRNVRQQHGQHLTRRCTSFLQAGRKPLARQPGLVIRKFPIGHSAHLFVGEKNQTKRVKKTKKKITKRVHSSHSRKIAPKSENCLSLYLSCKRVCNKPFILYQTFLTTSSLYDFIV